MKNKRINYQENFPLQETSPCELPLNIYNPELPLHKLLLEFKDVINKGFNKQKVTRALLRVANTVYVGKLNECLAIYSFILEYDSQNYLVKGILTKKAWYYARSNQLSKAMAVVSVKIKAFPNDNESLAMIYTMRNKYFIQERDRLKFRAMVINNYAMPMI